MAGAFWESFTGERLLPSWQGAAARMAVNIAAGSKFGRDDVQSCIMLDLC